ncbi:MAG: hypothetical protein ABFR95_10030 [Actinomycetota bacterium]
MKRTVIVGALLALVAAACGSAANTTATTPAAPDATTTTSVSDTTTSSTQPPTTTTSTVPETSPEDQAAITLAYEVVFSSETDFEEKAPYIVDPSGLEETVINYMEAGESMGGVSLAARTITVDGDTAKVIYDFLFAGTPTYPDLTGDAVRNDGTWQITREMFCSIMTSARVGCPSS